jgi:secreted trypsin-like serine protease
MRFVLLACFAITLPVQAENLGQRLDLGGLTLEATPYIVAAGDINSALYSTPRGGIADSVAGLLLQTTAGNFLCSGTLLPSGMDILTAAHCVTDINGQFNLLGGSATFFPNPSGTQVIPFAGAQKFSAYNGNLFAGNDLAVIHLQSPAAPAIPRENLYTSTDELGKTYNVVGFGATGSLGVGYTPGSAGGRHQGFNQFDATLAVLGLGSNVLLSDFDNGTPEHDGFGFFFGLDGLGLGLNEVVTAPGDSGGPAFIDGKIAGITSFGLQLSFPDGSTSDIDGVLNSSFGEFDGFTRVSSYAGWITGPHDFTLVPEPGTWLLTLASLGLLARRVALRAR